MQLTVPRHVGLETRRELQIEQESTCLAPVLCKSRARIESVPHPILAWGVAWHGLTQASSTPNRVTSNKVNIHFIAHSL